MFISKLLFLVFASSCIASSVKRIDTVLVLYYEGLCPYCHEFITEQLYPAYQKLGDSFLVDLVPYGNADYSKNADGSVDFDCQHGPKECLINRIHACALNGTHTQAQILNFVHCGTVGSSSSNTDEELLATAQQCAEQSDLSFDDINSCVASSEADGLLLAYAERQAELNPQLEYVPNIRFNDVFDETQENNAREDLVWTLCNLMQDKPSACDDAVKKFRPRKFPVKISPAKH